MVNLRSALLIAFLTSAAFAGCGRSDHDGAQPVTRVARAATGQSALLVVGSLALAAGDGDSALKSRLENALGFAVTLTTGAGDLTGKSLVVISESANAATVGATYQKVTVPVVVLKSALFANMGMTTSANVGTRSAQTQIVIATGGHPMTAKLTGTQTVTSSGQGFGWGTPSATGETVATIVGSTTQAAIFAYRVGVTMVAPTGSNTALVAPARRVGWFAPKTAFSAPDATGTFWKLFDASVNWATMPDAALLVAGSTSAALAAGDQVMRNRLERDLGLGVRLKTSSAVTATADQSAWRLIVLSQSGGVPSTTPAISDWATPMLVLQPTMFNPLRMVTGSRSGTDYGSSSASQIEITTTHPLAGTIAAGTVTVASSAQTMDWGATVAASSGSVAGAVTIARVPGSTNRWTIFGYPKGSRRTDWTSSAPRTMPARRVGWFATPSLFAAADATGNLWKLFDAAVGWATTATLHATCEASTNSTACNDNNACTAGDACKDQVCAATAVPNGTACPDGNRCNGAETCQSGACVAGGPIACNAPPACHAGPGTCDAATGACSYPMVADGTSCGDADRCNGDETCRNGTCAAGAPVACNTPPACHGASGTCEAATGSCSYPVVADGTSCADGDRCNGDESCRGGSCAAGAPVVCASPPSCQSGPGTCNPTNGACTYAPVANGTICADSNKCNGDETCQHGACAAGNAVRCDSPPACHAGSGTCDASTGACSYAVVADGTSCADADKCNGSEVCQGGGCVPGADRIVCQRIDQCHGAGQCNPATGTCSHPVLAAAACNDGNDCTRGDVCSSDGQCAGALGTCSTVVGITLASASVTSSRDANGTRFATVDYKITGFAADLRAEYAVDSTGVIEARFMILPDALYYREGVGSAGPWRDGTLMAAALPHVATSENVEKMMRAQLAVGQLPELATALAGTNAAPAVAPSGDGCDEVHQRCEDWAQRWQVGCLAQLELAVQATCVDSGGMGCCMPGSIGGCGGTPVLANLRTMKESDCALSQLVARRMACATEYENCRGVGIPVIEPEVADVSGFGHACIVSTDCPIGGRCERGRCDAPVTGIWETKPNAGSPAGQITPSGEFDPVLAAPLVFGGYGGPSFSVNVNDTFVYREGAWQLLTPTTSKPPGGCCAAMVFDNTRGVWWMYGSPAGGSQGNMWSFDPRTLAWSEILRGEGWAPGSVSQQMVYDSKRSVSVLPAAWDVGGTITQIWEWNGTAWSHPTPPSSPSWRYQPIVGFDQARGQMVMFGGRGRTDPSVAPWNANIILAETWTWDGVTWTQRQPVHSPPARADGSMTYDSYRRRLVLYGGRRDAAADPSTTWEWDGNDWIATTTAAGPYEGYGVRLAYDPSRKRIVGYGYGQTAEYHTVGTSCDTGADCGSGNCVDGLCCRQSACDAGQVCNGLTQPGFCATP